VAEVGDESDCLPDSAGEDLAIVGSGQGLGGWSPGFGSGIAPIARDAADASFDGSGSTDSSLALENDRDENNRLLRITCALPNGMEELRHSVDKKYLPIRDCGTAYSAGRIWAM
jgi:hypothetical protein